MEVPEELGYLDTHEWVATDGTTAIIGLSDYAQNELGDLVFVNLPEVGDEVVAGEVFGDVESVKAVSDIISPVSGTVAEVNEKVLDNPEIINEKPYEAWFIHVNDATLSPDIIDAAEYAGRYQE
ncbi:MAG: glycine cleavage system protein GcvH [Raoultibacter sp.]